ncbi:hypothetical protein DFH09DRAFT_1346861 [Mycena vulgaris]|nr:hypothetical protein DFH09DRAFT_1346861 [Mycena vulgaris]
MARNSRTNSRTTTSYLHDPSRPTSTDKHIRLSFRSPSSRSPVPAPSFTPILLALACCASLAYDAAVTPVLLAPPPRRAASLSRHALATCKRYPHHPLTRARQTMRMHLPTGRPTSPLSIRPAVGARTPDLCSFCSDSIRVSPSLALAPFQLLTFPGCRLSTYIPHTAGEPAESVLGAIRVYISAGYTKPRKQDDACSPWASPRSGANAPHPFAVLPPAPTFSTRRHISQRAPRDLELLAARAPAYAGYLHNSVIVHAVYVPPPTPSMLHLTPPRFQIQCTSTRRSTTAAGAHGIPHPSTE